MNASKPSKLPDAVAITGYGYRMPGGIRSDADFWRLLCEREIVREPIVDRYGKGHRPIGELSGPGRLASPWEGLIRDDDELLFDRALFGCRRRSKNVPARRQTAPRRGLATTSGRHARAPSELARSARRRAWRTVFQAVSGHAKIRFREP